MWVEDSVHVCGETDRFKIVKQSFTDRDGEGHTVEYFEVISVAPSDEPTSASAMAITAFFSVSPELLIPSGWTRQLDFSPAWHPFFNSSVTSRTILAELLAAPVTTA